MRTFVNFMTCVLFLYCITGVWTASNLHICQGHGEVSIDKRSGFPSCSSKPKGCNTEDAVYIYKCVRTDFISGQGKLDICCRKILGYYGANCTSCQNCTEKGPNVEPNMCNKDNGLCICKPGWRSAVCQDNCPLGYYGSNCTPCPNCTEKGPNVEPNVCNRDNGLCICKPGWYSSNCQHKCDKGYFGRNCVFKCTCAPEQCDHIVGCFTNKQRPNDTSAYPTPITVPDSGISIQTVTMVTVPGTGVRTQTVTLISMYITVTCGVIGLLLLASICCIKYRQIKGRRQENKYHKYPTGDLSLNGVQNVSEYSEITEIESYTCSNATEPSDLIKAYDHLDHHPSTSSENIHIYDDPRKESMHWQSKTGPIKQYYDHLCIKSGSMKMIDNSKSYDHINL